MLIDMTKNPNVEIKKIMWLQYILPTASTTITFDKSGVNLTTTKIVFLLDAIYCQKIDVVDMYYRVTLMSLTLTTLNVTISTNSLIADFCSGRIDHHFTLVIIYPHTNISIKAGITTIAIGASNKISLTVSSPLNSYLVGVYDMELPDSCFKFGLETNLTIS